MTGEPSLSEQPDAAALVRNPVDRIIPVVRSCQPPGSTLAHFDAFVGRHRGAQAGPYWWDRPMPRYLLSAAREDQPAISVVAK